MADALDWESLVEQHYPRMYRAALVMTGRPADAEDLAQETFLQAIQTKRPFAGKSRIDTWLYGILLNLHRRNIRTIVRRERRRLRQFELFGQSLEENHQQDLAPDRRLQMQQWQQSIWRAVADLPEAQQSAIVLRYSEGLTNEQIAQVLGCPLGTVKSRIHHGLSQLQKTMSSDFDLAEVKPWGKTFSLCRPTPLK